MYHPIVKVIFTCSVPLSRQTQSFIIRDWSCWVYFLWINWEGGRHSGSIIFASKWTWLNKASLHGVCIVSRVCVGFIQVFCFLFSPHTCMLAKTLISPKGRWMEAVQKMDWLAKKKREEEGSAWTARYPSSLGTAYHHLHPPALCLCHQPMEVCMDASLPRHPLTPCLHICRS